jgi:hypothetical protein
MNMNGAEALERVSQEALLATRVSIQRERYSEALCQELLPMLQDNWVRTESYIGDLPIDPAFDKYQKLDAMDLVTCVTARRARELVGYAIFFTSFSLHHKSVKTGHGDMIYVKQDAGLGRVVFAMLDECERLLRVSQVRFMGWFVHKDSKIHRILASRGYREDELVMEKRL